MFAINAARRREALLEHHAERLRDFQVHTARQSAERAAKRAKISADDDVASSTLEAQSALARMRQGMCPRVPGFEPAAEAAGVEEVRLTSLTTQIAARLYSDMPRIKSVAALVKEYDQHFGLDPDEAVRRIDAAAIGAYLHAIKDTTRNSYDSGVLRWEFLFAFLKKAPYPVDEEMCERFAAACSVSLTVGTISQYLSAVRSRCIDIGMYMPERSAMPRLQRTLHGLKMAELATKGGRTRMALTIDISRNTLVVAKQRFEKLVAEGRPLPSIYSPDHYLVQRVVFSVPTTGMMRPSEFAVRRTESGFVSEPLLVKHYVQIADERDPNLVTGANLVLPHRKTASHPSSIYLGRTGDDYVCAISALNELLLARQAAGEVITGDSPLVLVERGGKKRPIEYADLVGITSATLRAAGYDDSQYKGHSFRIGAATTLALAGVPTSAIEAMGGWKPGSLSLPGYIREQVSASQRRLMCSFFTRPYRRAEEEQFVLPSVRRLTLP